MKVIYSFQKLNKVVMPSIVDDELSFASNDSTLVDSPRRCKSHVEGAIIPDGLLDAGEICAFSTLEQVKCDLCLKRNRLVHNPVTNKQVSLPPFPPKCFQCVSHPFGAALDSEEDFLFRTF
jgi:hypothetical protein